MSAEVHILELCKKLQLPDDLQHKSLQIFREIQSQNLNIPKDQRNAWFVCLLYAAHLDQRYPYGINDPQSKQGSSCFTVTEILKAADFYIVDFFKLMKQVKEYYHLNEVVLTNLVSLEKKYCVTSPLFVKFEKMFEEIFQRDENFSGNRDSDEQEVIENFETKKQFCWTLFVLVKECTMKGNMELVLCFELLLCCLDHVVRSTPSFQLKSPFDCLKVTETEKPEDQVVLQQLSSNFSVTYEEVKAVQFSYLNPVVKSLKDKDALELRTLSQQYDNLYKQNGDIDELLFLQREPHLVRTVANTPDRDHSSGTSVRSTDQVVPQSPSSMRPPDTPVRSAIYTVQQLQNLLNTAKDQPSTALLKNFQNCSQNPNQHIEQRIEEMRPTFMEKFSDTMGKEFYHLGNRRFQLAIRLYYRELESLLKLEEEKLSVRDFSQLLNNAVFHKCLFVCCIEVVLITYSPNFCSSIQSPNQDSSKNSCAFPWVLDVFDVKAYDFFKVLDSFIRAEPKLTKDVVKHLQRIENIILDSLAWQTDSPLLEALVKYETMLSAIPQFSNTDVNMNNNAVTSQMYLSPMRPRSNVKSPLCTVPNITMNSSPSKPARSHSLNLFLNKVCRLAYQRLQTLCNLMALSKDLHQKIWSCVEYVITKKHELLFNRHLDQILLCSIYAVCKVASDMDIKLQTIVATYRYLPHATQQIYKQIQLTPGEHDTIIHFYNKIFMHAVKNYLMQFSIKPVSMCQSPIPKSPLSQNLQASPIFSLPGRDNFFVSPMKQSPFKVPQSPSQLTPRTRQLYCFGEGLGNRSAEKFREINAAIKRDAILSSGGPKSQKRLKFDQAEAGPSNRSPSVSDVIIVKRIAPSSQTRKSLNFTE